MKCVDRLLVICALCAYYCCGDIEVDMTSLAWKVMLRVTVVVVHVHSVTVSCLFCCSRAHTRGHPVSANGVSVN